MQEMARWTERRFPYQPPAGEFPMILERLRGTPDRVEKKVAALPKQLLIFRHSDAWSIQEHVGHLIDLESLWSNRLTELLEGKPELSAADMTNRRTYDAHHNDRAVHEIVGEFRFARMALVRRLEDLNTSQVVASARHPRLEQPMRAIDLCLFVAEHDDHHLALMTRTQRRIAGIAK